MALYEFTTQITEAGYVELPAEYAAHIPLGSAVHVRILTKQNNSLTVARAAELARDSLSPNRETQEQATLALEEFIASVKNRPAESKNIHAASGKLIEHLSLGPVETLLDSDVWDQEWAAIEAGMKAASLAHEQGEVEDLVQ